METTIKELMDAVDNCNNVKALWYNPKTGFWVIEFKDDPEPMEIDANTIMDFLCNG